MQAMRRLYYQLSCNHFAFVDDWGKWRDQTDIWCYVICKSNFCSIVRRILAKGKRFQSTVTSFSSVRKSILRRSLRPSINKEFHCWERHPALNKYSILSRRSTTAQSFRKYPFLPGKRAHCLTFSDFLLQARVLHNLPYLHQQTDSVYGDSAATD